MKKCRLLLIGLLLALTLAACQSKADPKETEDVTTGTGQSANQNTGTENGAQTENSTQDTMESSTQDSTQDTAESQTQDSSQDRTDSQTQNPTQGNTGSQPQNPTQSDKEETSQGGGTAAESVPKIVAEGNVSKTSGTTAKWKLTEDGTLTIYGDAVIEDQTSRYPWTQYKSQVKKLVVESGIKNVPAEAFLICNKLTEAVLADSVETIGEKAFSNCKLLTEITIPAKVKEIETGAFAFCTSLKKVEFAPGSRLGIIGPNAFHETALEEFIAPPNLKRIQSRAFANSEALKTVILNDSLEYIGAYVFEYAGLMKIIVYATEGMSDYAFSNSGVEHYESYVTKDASLAGLVGLKTAIFRGNGTSIPKLGQCTALTSVTIQRPITKIEKMHFIGCKALVDVIFPDTVEEIEAYAFVDTGLQKITIPASVKKMGICVFNKTNLQQITFVGDPPVFDSNATDGTFSGVGKLTAYYPANNPAWTEAVLQNYGAENVTWIAK